MIAVLALLLTLLAASLQAATPTITAIKVLAKSHSCVTVEWTTNETCSSCEGWMQYDDADDVGYNPASLTYATAQLGTGGATTGYRKANTCDLIPGGNAAILVSSRDSTTNEAFGYCSGTCGGGECTSANSGGLFADGSGFTCPVDAEPPIVAMNSHPTGGVSVPAPTAPSHSIDLSTLVGLACDSTEETTCDGMQTAINAAEAAATSTNVCVVRTDYATPCAPEDDSSSNGTHWVLPVHTESTWVIIQSGADAKMLPPAGTAVSPEYRPWLARFKYNEAWLGADAGDTSLFQATAGSSGRYMFRNVEVAPPNDPATQVFTVSNATGSSPSATVTVSDTQDLKGRALVYLDMEGIRGFNGAATLESSGETSTTFQVEEKFTNGTFTSGTAKRAGRIDLTSCSGNGDGTTTCTMNETNPFPDYSAGSITNIASGNQITIDVNRQALEMINNSNPEWNTVLIENSTDCDGLHAVIDDGAGSPWTLLELGGSPGCTACSSSCGDIWKAGLINIRDSSNASLNGTFHFKTGPSSTQVTLYGVDQSGSGGHIGMYEIGWKTPFDVSGTSGPYVFDRVLWSRNSKYTMRSAVASDGQPYAVTGQWSDFQVHAGLIDPINGYMWTNYFGLLLFQDAVSFYVTGDGDDVQVQKGTSISSGFHFFKDVTRVAEDISYLAMTAFTPAANLNGGAANDGRYFKQQQMLEFKMADRAEFSAILSGGFSERAQSGQALMFFTDGGGTAGEPATTRDVNLHDTAIVRANTGVQFTECSGGCGSGTFNLFPARFTAQNVLIVTDAIAQQSIPHPICGLAGCTIGGWAFGALPASSFIKNVTYAPLRAFWVNWEAFVGSYRKSEVRYEDFIGLYSEGNGTEAGFHSSSGTGNFTPALAGLSGSNYFLGLNRFMDGSDTLTGLAASVIIPGLESSYARTIPADFSSTSDATRITATEVNAPHAGISGLLTGNTVLSQSSTQAALDECFEAGTWQPKSTGNCASKGADLDAIADAQLFIRDDLAVTPLSNTSVRVSFTAPNSTDACYIQWTTAANGWGSGATVASVSSWATISAGAAARTYDITGRTAGVEDRGRITCGRAPLRFGWTNGS